MRLTSRFTSPTFRGMSNVADKLNCFRVCPIAGA